jgi:hypothetical protein
MPGVFPQVTVLICPHGGRYSNGPSRRRRDRGREGWGLWMTGRDPGTQPGDPTPGTKSGTIVPKHSVLRYNSAGHDVPHEHLRRMPGPRTQPTTTGRFGHLSHFPIVGTPPADRFRVVVARLIARLWPLVRWRGVSRGLSWGALCDLAAGLHVAALNALLCSAPGPRRLPSRYV